MQVFAFALIDGKNLSAGVKNSELYAFADIFGEIFFRLLVKRVLNFENFGNLHRRGAAKHIAEDFFAQNRFIAPVAKVGVKLFGIFAQSHFAAVDRISEVAE